MAYKGTNVPALSEIANGETSSYVCDTPADISSLPTTPDRVAWGSTAFVVSTQQLYMLGSDRVWRTA